MGRSPHPGGEILTLCLANSKESAGTTAFQGCHLPAWPSNVRLVIVGALPVAAGGRHMTDSVKRAADPGPAHPGRLLEKAVNNLSMGLVVFDKQRKVVFCNKRYMEIYGLSSEQVKPGTPLSKLIQRRLDMGHKAPSNSDAYIRERFRDGAVPTATVQEFSDGRTIIFTVYPMPD